MPTSLIHHSSKRQSGVSVVTALFLIIVLSLLAAGMVSMLATSQQSVSQEVTSTKAYMASRSCLQWAMYQAVYSSASGSFTNTFSDSASGSYPARCTTTINSISNDGLTFYNITASARLGSKTDPEYSQRELRLQFQP